MFYSSNLNFPTPFICNFVTFFLIYFSLFLPFSHCHCFVFPLSFLFLSVISTLVLSILYFPCASSPLFLFPLLSSFCLHQTSSNSIGLIAPSSSWCFSPGLLGCYRGLQRPRQNLCAVRHHCVQTQPRRQWRLLEDLPTLFRLPWLPYEDHWTGSVHSNVCVVVVVKVKKRKVTH